MPVTERLPATLGPYRLQERLGEGGMGVVHLARDPQGRSVAIKVLRNVGYADENARRRLIREVETMRRVHSPYVAEVLDADVTGEFPYIVTRYVSGPTLDQLVRRQGPLSPGGVQRLAQGLAEALAAIHATGVVHRDLKPGNVMLTDDRPVVIDFGIAQAPEATRLTQTGMVMGTPGYLAPEVIQGQPSSPASDVHAWGATVAFAATGQPPFGSGSFETIFFRVISGRADLTGVPSSLVPLVSAALSTDPASRPSAAVLAGAGGAGAGALLAGAGGAGAGAIGTAVDAGGAGVAAGPAAVPAAARVSFSPIETSDGYSPTRTMAPGAAARDLLPHAPIGRAGVPDDPGRAPRREPRARSAGPSNPKWLPGLAFTAAAAALTVVLPVAGLVASLIVITVLRAADMAQSRRAVRGGGHVLGVIVRAPFSVIRALFSTVLLAPFALVAGGLAWAGTIIVTHHPADSKSIPLAAAAMVVCYGIGPGSGKPRRQLRRIAGSLARTPMSATAATIATWALAAAAITFALSQVPDYWPAVLPAVPHASLPHLPGLPRFPSLDSLVSSTAGWLTRHTHT
jgi:predicted Ser/Thr protein kinase